MYLVSPLQDKSNIQKHPLIKTWSTFTQNSYFFPPQKSVSLGKEGVNHFTAIGRFSGQEGHTGSSHVAQWIEGFDSIPASQVLLKSAKVWPS